MRTLRNIGIGLLASLCWACVDDPGNYTYEDLDSVLSIEILGLRDTTFTINETVALAPEVKGLDDESNYWFTWYTYRGGSGIPERDTICRERNLSFVMKYPSGEERTLVYEIKDKRTGVFVNEKVEITSITKYSQGWLVLKDENNETDIDFAFPDGNVDENILDANSGYKLKGTAVKIVNQTGYYTHQLTYPDGTTEILDGIPVWHVLSSQDMVTLNPDDLSIYKYFKDEFYAEPSEASPQDLYENWGDMLFMNAGQLYGLYGMTDNVGKFGFAKLSYDNLYPAMLADTYGALVFSQDVRSFVFGTPYDPELLPCSLPEAGNPLQVKPTEMDAEMLALLQRGELPTIGWALMKSVSGKEEYYLADVNVNGTDYPFVDFDTISPMRELLYADVYAANQLNSIWYAKGNKLSYYTKDADDETSFVRDNLYPFPAGETIMWMQQWEEKYLLVITSSDAGWKLYRFELEEDGLSPNLKPGAEPKVWSGNGTARYALWIGELEEE